MRWFTRKPRVYNICDDTIRVVILPCYDAGRFTTYYWSVSDIFDHTRDGYPLTRTPFDHGRRRTKRECYVAAYNAALKHTDDAS